MCPSSQDPRDRSGPSKAAGVDKYFEDALSHLRALAAREMSKERADHTLQPSALVNEVYLRLAGEQRPEVKDSEHFFRLASTTLRRVLVDHARARHRVKRGGGMRNDRVALEALEHLAARQDPSFSGEEILAMESALDTLKSEDAQLAQFVELRYFGGRSIAEIASLRAVSERTVYNELAAARAKLETLIRNAPQE